MLEIQGKYTNAFIYTDNVEQEAISQIYNLCNHPAFENATIRLMPDIHAGSGCTIGTTVKLNKKMIIPNIVGVDIGCGVLTTIFTTNKEIDFKSLDDFILTNVPNGNEVRKNKHKDLDKKIEQKVKEIIRDLNLGNEEYFLNSIGSLGGGNHYIEIGRINKNTYSLSVHSGSRNLGKKVCEYFQSKAKENVAGKNKIQDAQKELITKLKKEHREKEISIELMKLKNSDKFKITGIPKNLEYIEDKDFDAYIINMLKCQTMASTNRELMSKDIMKHLIHENEDIKILEVFDTIHNYIEQTFDKNNKPIYYIRKGAISAKQGEKVAIPLNMKDGVIIGIGKGNKEWNYSAPHGAGRLMSRSKAKENVSLEEFKESMKGIQTWSVCSETIDESPQAYKPAEEIVELVQDTIDIQYIVKPIYNFKSHTPTKSWAEIKAEEKARKQEIANQ